MRETSMLSTSSGAAGEEEMVRLPRPARTARRRKRLRPVEEEQSLTSRERQVLACFAQGLNTAGVARRFSISPTTVRNHAQRILSKLGAHSRLEAVARGYATGLLSFASTSGEPKGKGRKE